MAVYAIGDIQGCFNELQKLLNDKIKFNPNTDQLWFTGDLVNRGPQSLEVLRFIKSLGEKHITVLGNHDLHLLAVAQGVETYREKDTFSAVLKAKDKDELISWLKTRKLCHFDKKNNYFLVHAGLAPFWTVEKAQSLAREVESILRSGKALIFLNQIYGNYPDQWSDELFGIDRLRCIVNYFTRMRLCHADGRLELTYKGPLETKPADLIPWFDVKNRVNKEVKIIFGHWAALGGKADVKNVYPLDTGCVWGNCLTAIRLEDEKIFSVKCNPA